MKTMMGISLLIFFISSGLISSTKAWADNATLFPGIYESKNSARVGKFSIAPIKPSGGSPAVTIQMIIFPDVRNKLKGPEACDLELIDKGGKSDQMRYQLTSPACGVVGFIQNEGRSLNVGWGNSGELLQDNIYYAK